MKYAELQGKTEDQLNELVTDMQKERFNLRFQSHAGESVSTARYRALRRDIARAKTYLQAQKLGIATAAAPAKEKKAAKAKPAKAPAKAANKSVKE